MRLSPAQAYVKAIADGNEVEEKRLGDLLNTYQKLEEAREAVDGLVLDAALRLASAGIPVFPIRPGLKTDESGRRPLIFSFGLGQTACGFDRSQNFLEQFLRTT